MEVVDLNANHAQPWPITKGNPENQPAIALHSFEELTDMSADHVGITVFTDGWQVGTAAAVLRGGANATAVLHVLAQAGVKAIHIFHREEQIPQLEEIFFSSVVIPSQDLFDSVTITWRQDASLFDLVKNFCGKFSMLFFGAPLAFSEIQPFYQQIRAVYASSVTIVRGPTIDVEIDTGDEIYQWVRERTFDAGDFSLPDVLRMCKKRLNKKIAIILPSLNEAGTVSNVIKTALEVKDAGLIDEVILVDSASTDDTVDIAKSLGIPVFLHSEIKPELGSYTGKGEAIYKSGFVTDAAILAWIDTDIESITPRFFYGLLGPLLTNSAIKFAKGYFNRPVKVDASGIELGGGRVTEIMARPWINTFQPQLSGYIQPLAGTVAIYRDTFLKMQIPVNYGVEVAMLLQAVELEGLWATCQVNLGEVVHKSKDVAGLSEMAFQIMQSLADMGNMRQPSQRHDILRKVYSAYGHFEIGSKRFRTVWRNYGDTTLPKLG
jgi:glycosyltransferase involved in cell wall biosynthesis